MTREASGGDTKATQEAADEGETKVDEVVDKVIKRMKYYNISFQLGFYMSRDEVVFGIQSS